MKSKLITACAILLAANVAANAAVTCVTSDYIGTYAFLTIGGFLQLPPSAAILQGPFSQAGTFVSDGAGNLIITSTASYNGNVLPANDPAIYTLGSDCTLTYNLTLPLPLQVPATFVGVLSRGARENTVSVTNPPGTVVVGRHSKLDMRFCGQADFTGAYSIDWTGAVVASAKNAAPGPFQRIGRIVSDGNGNFTAATTANFNGTSVQDNFTGTYVVNAACALSLSYTTGAGSSSQAYSVVGSLGGHGDIAYVMVATPGWSVSGTLTAQ